MGEQEPAATFRTSCGIARGDRDWKRNPRECPEGILSRDGGRERRVGRRYWVPEGLEYRESPAVAPGVRHREPASRDDNGIDNQGLRALALYPPFPAKGLEPNDCCLRQKARSTTSSEC